MIRFCDKEVCSVAYNSIERNELLSYFFSGHMEDIICVMDDTYQIFKGKITYYSLINSDHIDHAIEQDYVVLDESIWENGRKYFRDHARPAYGEIPLLPVLNGEHELLCFAYQDEDANRQLRMLRELQEKPDAKTFCDVYPGFSCVTLNGFNELAYFFAKYIKNRGGVQLNIEGEFWKYFGYQDHTSVLDYENYTIYCEGRWNRNKNLEEYLLRTVAVEFECVDAIYEEAVKDGFILDALGNSDDLLQRLQNEKEIVIIGIGADSQDVYDCLLGKGIEAVCFLSFSQEDYGRQLFDKEILSESDIRNKFQNPVFIDCQNRNSAWGFGKTDHYDYMGYHRNVRYILWRDYQDILSNNLYHVLKGKNIILLGEELRCRRIQRNLRERGHLNVTYENILDEIHQGSNSFNNSLKDTVYLLTIDEGYEIDNEAKQKSLREKYIRRLSEIGIFSFSEYFSDFERMAKLRDKNSDGMASILKPKGILVGVIDFFSGNILFNGIMDGHPNILSMPHCCLCNMLYSVSIRLAEEKAECFIDRFWILLNEYSNDEYDLSQEFPDKEVFERKVYELLAGKSSFISQEIFVILFMAYSSMWGQETSELQNSFIYWESHGMNRLNLEICAEWLAMADIQIFEIKLKRNSLVRAGSAIKIYESQTKFTASSVPYVGIGLVSERKKMQQINLHSYYMKFEDLKQYPERELKKICLWAGLTWNKSMLTTTEHGKVSGYECLGESISGFDLKPVYRLYEEYLSEFDRMRIGMINQLFQKKYGYSYVKSMDFSRYELQEMMLRPFKFEKMLTFINDRDYLRYRKKMYRILHYWLQKIRRMEILNIEDDMEYFR